MYSINFKKLGLKTTKSSRLSKGRELEDLIPAVTQAPPCRYRMSTRSSECGMPVKATGMWKPGARKHAKCTEFDSPVHLSCGRRNHSKVY